MVKVQLSTTKLFFFMAMAALLAAPDISAQELRLEITGRRNPLADNLFPVIYGKLENDAVMIGEVSFPLSAPAQFQPSEAPAGPVSAPPVRDLQSSPSGAEGRKIAAASFSVKSIDDPGCLESRNVKEIFFLIGLLKDDISHLSISTPRNTVCHSKLKEKLSSLGRLEQDQDPLKDKIRVRLHFTANSSSPAARSSKSQQETPLPVTQQPKQAPPAQQVPDRNAPLVVTINGEIVETDNDGWFVYEPASTDAQIVSVRQGANTLLVKSYTPAVLKAGTTERKTKHYRYIYLVTNAARPLAMIAPERLDLKNIVNLSLPFFIKAAYGNTRLYPLPGEGKVDRPTVLAGLKSHPILYGMHIEADGFLSYKPDSQIPWTTLVTGVIGNDFMELGHNLSLPWGVGGRAFKSKIDNTKASSGESDPAASGKVLIPESVLGPAASLGVRYRNNYVYADATMIVTPLKLPGSDLIVTYNPSVYLGYQVTGADTVTLNYQTHDVRFPTKSKVVRVTASIVALGYVRDLQ